MAGLYVHIPFCKSRCVYCAFYSTTTSGMAEKYVSALCREMDLRPGYCSPEWQTVYIGGGTPSTLPPDQLQRLFSRINCSHATEITIECNPDDVTPAFASLLASLPVNRVSMGAQTFDDSRLRFLRRRHGAADVSRAVDCLRAAGIDNISVEATTETGISSVVTGNDSQARTDYFTVSGTRINRPTAPGTYIVRTGKDVKKVVLK